MKRISVVSIVLAITLTWGLSSCKNTLTPGIDQVVFPDTGTVSYQKYVQPLFNLACLNSGCHDGGPTSNNLILTDYISATTSAPGVIIPKDTTSSLLIQYVEGRYPHDPLLVAVLTPNQIQGLKKWILQGAKNN